MSPLVGTRFGPARVLAGLVVAAAAVLGPVVPASAAPVCGGTACVEIVANSPTNLVDIDQVVALGFAVTISDPALLPLPVDILIPDGLTVEEDSLSVNGSGPGPGTPIPGGVRVVLADPTVEGPQQISLRMRATATLTAAEVVVSTTFTSGGLDHTASALSAFELRLTDLEVRSGSGSGPVPVSGLGRSVVSFDATIVDGGYPGTPIVVTLTVTPGFLLQPQVSTGGLGGSCTSIDPTTVRCVAVIGGIRGNITADPGTPVGTTGTITAALDPPASDPNPANDSVTMPLVAVGTANLQVTTTPTDVVTPTGVGGSVDITITNNGPDPAVGYFVNLESFVPFPANWFIASINGSTVIDQHGSQLSLNGLAPGASLVIPVIIYGSAPYVADLQISTYVYSRADFDGVRCGTCINIGSLKLTITDIIPPVTTSPSSAEPTTSVPTSTVPTTTVSTSVTSVTSGSSTLSAAGPGLANTGSPTNGLVAVGVALLLVGGATTRLARPRRQAHPRRH